jgi:hypothetical protein
LLDIINLVTREIRLIKRDHLILCNISAHDMVYAAPMNESCFSHEGAKAQRTFFSCISWFKSIFTVKEL